MVAKAKASSNNDGDFFLPGLRGEVTIERLFQHNGDKGTSVILTAVVDVCESKLDGAQKHSPGAKVKKIYAISKFPEVAPGQLKGDILAIMGLREDDLSAKEMEALLGEIFTDAASAGFELRGYKTAFDTATKDRSDKGKEPLTVVKFKHMANDEAELSARKAAVDARLKGVKA